MPKSRDIQAKVSLPQAILNEFWLVAVKIANSNRFVPLFPGFQKSFALFHFLLYNIFKGITAHKGLTCLKAYTENATLNSPKFWGWSFYALNHYRQNVKTNVSNARMNIPKAIRSLKSKCFISTTPILCKNRGQPPCNTVIPFPYHSIFLSLIHISEPTRP